jgi:hypothetical protein
MSDLQPSWPPPGQQVPFNQPPSSKSKMSKLKIAIAAITGTTANPIVDYFIVY